MYNELIKSRDTNENGAKVMKTWGNMDKLAKFLEKNVAELTQREARNIAWNDLIGVWNSFDEFVDYYKETYANSALVKRFAGDREGLKESMEMMTLAYPIDGMAFVVKMP